MYRIQHRGPKMVPIERCAVRGGPFDRDACCACNKENPEPALRDAIDGKISLHFLEKDGVVDKVEGVAEVIEDSSRAPRSPVGAPAVFRCRRVERHAAAHSVEELQS